eukprot:11345540-Alexandrium_andersonii.AAC.1
MCTPRSPIASRHAPTMGKGLAPCNRAQCGIRGGGGLSLVETSASEMQAVLLPRYSPIWTR